MVHCDVCGRQVDFPFRCNYCGGLFCGEHRLPESHRCLNLPREAPYHVREGMPQRTYNPPIIRDRHKRHRGRRSRGGRGDYERKKFSRKQALVVVLTGSLLVMALFLLVMFSQLSPPPFVSPVQSQSPSITPRTASPIPTIAPSATPIAQNQEAFANYALSLINTDRQQHGLQNVSLSSINSGQLHAEEMLKKSYFSHWDTNGYKPHMRYTLAGGQGAVAENIAWQGLTGNIFGIDVKSTLKDMQWSMMYDDASSNWGHKDNILNPLHNKVSIGIAYDNHNVYFVQDFEDDYVTWNTLSVNSNQVTMQGTIQKQGLTIQSVSIFYDKPTSLTVAQLDNSPYNGGYDPGTYVGMALPQNWQATGAITIPADSWNQNGVSFQISFSLSQAIAAYGKGVYTLYVQTGPSTADSLTTYSVWIN